MNAAMPLPALQSNSETRFDHFVSGRVAEPAEREPEALKTTLGEDQKSGGEGGSLGIYTKRFAFSDLRLDRYSMQSAARAALMWYKGPFRLKALGMRVTKCLRVPMARSINVVQRGAEDGSVFYRGLCLCGSVWACPVCSAKISEVRRQELDRAVIEWKKRDGHLGLLTLTFPHCFQDQLGEMLPKFTEALRYFSTSGTFHRIWSPSAGLVHRVRATEFTYGANGWHPHVHILLFLDKKLDTENTESLKRVWFKSCVKAGLKRPSDEHGVDLRDGTYASQYVGKWGITHELTKANSKKGRHGSQTPWDFLRAILDTGDYSKGLPFVHYVLATKGTRQLCWSKGARVDLGIANEQSDQEIVNDSIDELDQVLASLTLTEWRMVLSSKDGRTRLLQAAESSGKLGIAAFLAFLLPSGSKDSR